jgi:hypothetical protein
MDMSSENNQMDEIDMVEEEDENISQVMLLINFILNKGFAGEWTDDDVDEFLQELDSLPTEEYYYTYVYSSNFGSVCSIYDMMIEYDLIDILGF